MNRRTQLLAHCAAVFLLTACGGGGGGGGGAPPVLNISIGSMPNGVLSNPYNSTVSATGGTGARTFSITMGALPAGLMLNAATGAVTGTPTGPVGTSNFTIRVTDSGTPQQSDSQQLSILINAAAAGRNDSIATATAIGNGTFTASISPLGHPATIIDADEDFYEISTTASSTVTIDINADEINLSAIDSVIELLAPNGTRLNTCFGPTFNSPCMDDDEVPGEDLDSFLEVRVTGATTFYLRVLEWRGDARPDLLYQVVVSGIN